MGSGRGRSAHCLEVVLASPCIVIGENVVVYHPSVVGPRRGGFTVLRPSVGGVDRIEERIVVNPAAVHRDGRLEVQVLVELDGGVAREEQPVGLRVVVLRSRDVLGRRGQVGSVELCPVVVRVVGIPDLGVSRGVNHREHHARAVGAGSGDDAVGTVARVGHVGAHGDPLEQVGIDAGLDVVPLVVGHADDALLVTVAAAHVVAQLVVAVGDGELIVLGHTGPIGLAEPVGLVLEAVRKRHGADLVHQILVLVHVQHVVGPRDLGDADIGVEVDLRALADLALLRGDQHDSVRSAGSVDSGRRGVLEDCHGFDVIRRQIGDRVVALADRDAVHDVERVVAGGD